MFIKRFEYKFIFIFFLCFFIISSVVYGEDEKSTSVVSNSSELKELADKAKSESKDENNKEITSNAFTTNEVKVTENSDEKSETTVKTEILDKVTAKEAGIATITKDFPIDGFVDVDTALRLRSWPWGDVVGEYPNGTSVKILGVSGVFYLVEVDGKQGYMHINYISTDKKKASKEEPYYPGDTKSGGAISLKDGIKASKEISEGKIPTVTTTTGGTTGGATTGANGKIVLNVPKICQGNTKTPHPWSACGPTSLGMAIAYYTGKDAGALTADLWYKCGSSSYGTNYDGMIKGAKAYGYTNAKWQCGVSQAWVRQQIKAGKPVIANVKNHFVVIKGIDDNGNVVINDPGQYVVERNFTWNDFCAWWPGKGAMILE